MALLLDIERNRDQIGAFSSDRLMRSCSKASTIWQNGNARSPIVSTPRAGTGGSVIVASRLGA